MADQPTPADMQKGQQVAMAGAEAAANAPPAEAQAAATTAMRAERDRTELAMTDADIDRIASALSPKLVQGFRDQGAFDPPPEPVQSPNQAPPAPGEPAEAPAPAAAGEPSPAPVKRTFAHRFMGA